MDDKLLFAASVLNTWQSWSECVFQNETARQGVRTRKRTCMLLGEGDDACPTAAIESKKCYRLGGIPDKFLINPDQLSLRGNSAQQKNLTQELVDRFLHQVLLSNGGCYVGKLGQMIFRGNSVVSLVESLPTKVLTKVRRLQFYQTF